MDKNNLRKEYSNGEITIVWQSGKCIHATVCTQTLPKVYNPNERPWIKPENASTEELKAQVSECPSGALTCFMNSEEKDEESSPDIKVTVLPNGPLMVSGNIEVKNKDGNLEIKSNNTAFCRCGASSNKPYCDGSHNAINFQD